MSTLTKQERQGLEDIFLSISTDDRKYHYRFSKLQKIIKNFLKHLNTHNLYSINNKSTNNFKKMRRNISELPKIGQFKKYLSK
jgi:uncharacterized FlgJ-related protein